MPFKNRLLLASLLIVLTGVLAIWFAPFAVSHSLRLWIWWKAREQKLTVKIDQIDAPLLRPVVVRGFRMTSAPDAALHIDVSAVQATGNLNLKAILMRMGGRAIRTLSVEGLHAELRRNYATGTTLTESGWATLQKLLPDSLNLGPFDLRVEDGPTVILLRSVSLSASQIEAGRFSADEVTIASPWFRQTFSQLRGATNWQDTRLTLGGLTLTRGLDVPSLTADLSHLGNQRVGLEFDADVFGGKTRGSISNEWRSRHSNWNVVGSAIMTKSPPFSISAMPKPPPGVKTGNTVLCAVSLASSVVVIVQPLRITAAASFAITVLPRRMPCWSANDRRTTSSPRSSIHLSASAAASNCSSLHRPWRSTKLRAVRSCDDDTGVDSLT